MANAKICQIPPDFNAWGQKAAKIQRWCCTNKITKTFEMIVAMRCKSACMPFLQWPKCPPHIFQQSHKVSWFLHLAAGFVHSMMWKLGKPPQQLTIEPKRIQSRPGSRSKQIKHGELPEILHKNGAFSRKIIRFSSHGAAPEVSSWISSGWPFLRMFTWSEMAISSFPTLKIAILGELSQHFQTPTEHFTAMDLRDLRQTPSRASRTKAASWDHSHGPKA